jgi:hypothetical protein
VVELAVPEKSSVRLDVLDSRGVVAERTGNDFERGIHNLSIRKPSPGKYILNVKTPCWDAAAEILC